MFHQTGLRKQGVLLDYFTKSLSHIQQVIQTLQKQMNIEV